ncbi:SAM-dependent methyltransferase [Thetidibacter halocola]|uniref:Class I SAM-dependent methyltransferase n=1 Tax=Thetidibacter halocola TaxID=2827239 RepID=A0A8J8B6C5_9RHOB|nr:cyclopropane-fatty-acyl-phospholipid synthase family protein [Thetidibacter halocola]MBS0123871.1 class I SAM-dependent methyltransferase [Thetidibacter halocola]
MWETVLRRVLRRMIVQGRLTLRWPDGRVERFGSGEGAPEVAVTLTEGAARALCLRPVLALGECYMDDSLTVEDDRLYYLLTLLVRNQRKGGAPVWMNAMQAVRRMFRRIEQRNDALRARRNVAHHYDLSDDFYRLFLDADMQYSCAYFERPDMTLEDAQAAKKAHIAHKLRIEPGMRVLDIGCGWGGMALTLARDYGARVTGVTLSRNQLATAQARAEAAGLSDRCTFRLLDYRKLSDRFDRIVSVGMLEHVGLPHYDEYFARVHDLLDPDGIALIHTIGRIAPPLPTSPWIAKYIFPGGYVPSLSDLAPALERSGLWTADIEVLRGHYGPTLNHWRQRFEAALPKVREMYDDRFIRMWRFYLVACEMAFEEQGQAVFQVQLSRTQHAVPATRRYLYEASRPADMRHAAE